MTTVSATMRRRIEAQGFVGLSDGTLAEVGPWLRLAPGICMVWAAIGTYLGSATVLWALVPFAALGAVLPGHPFDVIYNYGIRYMTGTRELPRYNAPRRFACAVGTVWLGCTGWAFYAGAATLGYVLGGLLVVVAGMAAFTDFCIASFIYGRLFGQPGVCSVEKV